MRDDIRKTAIAGSWYPGAPDTLRQEINTFFDRVAVYPAQGRIIGLIAPHAGYVYSGQVAAHAYRAIQGESFDAVIVVGPSHRASFRGVSIYDGRGYETPLGIVTVDTGLARRIMANGNVVSPMSAVHAFEHSIEIQLPFLQVALGEVPFVPLLMGDQDRQTCEDLALAIVKSVGEQRILIVGSSDLSHFHPNEAAVRLDKAVLSRLDKMDPFGLLRDLQEHDGEACGGGAMAVTIMAAKQLGADTAQLLKYANSGDVTGDRSSVVGYAAVVFCDTGNLQAEKNQESNSGSLTETEQKTLLSVARESIDARLTGRGIAEIPVGSERLMERRGAFVTLKKQGQLRGCVGYIEAIKPLYLAVREMAVSAAFNDPRFRPVKREELQELDVEISVLTPLQELKDIEEIEIGRHGIYIVKGFYSGLLLPQVATEYHWDKVTFLRETCRKAGLPPQAWKDPDTTIYIFSADVFGER